ncbi:MULTISPECIES: response regulator [unclassified Paenibacillus]|uniref:response regulator n=1 Tax=unclassified Paenibacillus TaxID=185978 RepID=UPI00088BE303|nr:MULTISPECIES: response regulator transcription factor [unclassified Paenibacillus]SDM43113.1 DNA-binding response regulator, OmpR family, contains REC and winged-helix (wHTH) domain [Paenibacillus sp. OK060]SLK20803.1 DNA-binding response regulator, OmpR family, contains REC and winged-helix (wHTH) domain [Paenibacillus sp. RU5A]SOC76294.1 DNA-binding response regulator, OmpR family, contains REC and winged-helix (wHTH) domain [Paenibacillus sp. RU26A]SOC77972.1 DNA-binding response regulato
MIAEGTGILVVEDDVKIRKLIVLYLEKEGYEVIEAGDGEEALDAFKKNDPCLVILDLMLPKISGEEVCKSIRGDLKEGIPIIMLTAKVEENNRIEGLKSGADDYVTKPFSPGELVARVESILRRTGQRCSKLTYRGVTIKQLRGEVHYNGETIQLTQHEFRLLYFLMVHPNQILTREQIIDELYPNNEKVVTERSIDVHIGRLREKLIWDGDNALIETIRGMGYRFVAFQK